MTSSSRKTSEGSEAATLLAHDPADVRRLVDYVLTNQLIGGRPEDVPLDRSLIEEGLLDSYEIIELVDFIERSWSIHIEDEELTKDNMGSIYKMAAFIRTKGGQWKANTA